MTTKVQEVTEEELKLADTASVLRSEIEFREEQLERLNQSILAETQLNATERDRRRVERQEFDAQLRQDREACEQELQALRYQQQRREAALDEREKLITANVQEAQAVLQQADEVKALRDQTLQERLEMEHIRVRTEQLRQESERLTQTYQTQAADISSRETALEIDRKQLTVKQAELEAWSREVEVKAATSSAEVQHLEVLRRDMEPKLAEFAAAQTASAEQAQTATALLKEAGERKQENEQLRAELDAYRQRLEAQSIFLADQHNKLAAYHELLKTEAFKVKELGGETPPVPALAAALADTSEPLVKRGPGRPRKNG